MKSCLVDIVGVLHKEQVYCYINYHPVTKLPFYVGMGKRNRYKPSCHLNNKNIRWDTLLRVYGDSDISTTVFPLDSRKEAQQWEKELISMLRSNGGDLYNMTEGGEGGDPCEEVRKVLSVKSREARKNRSAEAEILRRDRISKKRLLYHENMSEHERVLDSQRRKDIHSKRTPAQKKETVQKIQVVRQLKSSEEKQQEHRNFSTGISLGKELKRLSRTSEEQLAFHAIRSASSSKAWTTRKNNPSINTREERRQSGIKAAETRKRKQLKKLMVRIAWGVVAPSLLIA